MEGRESPPKTPERRLSQRINSLNTNKADTSANEHNTPDQRRRSRVLTKTKPVNQKEGKRFCFHHQCNNFVYRYT